MQSVLNLGVALIAFKLNKGIDKEGIEECESFCLKAKESFFDMLKIFQMAILMKYILFIFLNGLFNPKFDEFDFYY